MKKCMLFLVVLAMSATAWGGLSVSVSLRTDNSGACATVSGVAPANCCIWESEWCVQGNKYTLNVYIKGKDCNASGCKAIGPYTETLRGLSPGRYTVCVNVYCVCDRCCKCGAGSRLVARSSATFTVGGGGNGSSSSSSSSHISQFQSSP